MNATFRVRVRGMSCASCAAGIERALAQVPGARSVAVSYATALATIEGGFELRPIVEEEIRALGYEVEHDRAEADDDERTLAVRLAITAFFAMSAMVPASALLFGGERASVARALGLVSGVLATPALVVGGLPLFSRAVRSVRAGAPGMDLLVSLGAVVTFVHSLVALVRSGQHFYFDTSAMILTFALLGKLLEARAKRRGLGAVQALDALLPSEVHLVVDGKEREAPIDAVGAGDRVRVRAGERVPVDGVVCEGGSLVDAAILNGEWAPRSVAVGDRVPAGLLLHDGTLVVEAERAIGEREVDRIRRSVDGLLSSRAPMQRLADALSTRFAWLVLLSSAATLLVTGDFLRAVAVVVVACPCALGLATPMAVAVAAGRAARRGILFRDAESIELAAEVDRVLLDKTGTLTMGAPRVCSVIVAPGVERGEVLSVISRLETAVEHPIARALRAAAPPADLPLEISVTAGGGVVGRGASTWIAGNARFLRAHGVVVRDDHDLTTVHVARDGAWIATITLEDEPREGLAEVTAQLSRDGLRPALVTGDMPRAARRVADAAKIDEVYAAVSPLDKAALVTAAARRGERVAFVGDGLNDGPALTAAHVGIAVDGATEFAIECARIVLVHGDVALAREALVIARATRRRMRQNLAWAVGYNLLAIPAAAMGLLSPAIAALAMAASSVSVVANSLRAPSQGQRTSGVSGANLKAVRANAS